MRILCVHQGYELYGSDRMFILSLIGFRERYPQANITVHLPKNGKLANHITENKLVDELLIEPMAILRKTDIRRLRLGQISKCLWNLRTEIDYCNSFDIVYINSIVVLNYLLSARFTKSKVILHLHEIPSKGLTLLFGMLIGFSRAFCFFISKAVKDRFNLSNDSEIVINGIPGYEFRKRDFKSPLNLLMIGRINSWKGQDFLVKTLETLTKKEKVNFKLKIVGSVFENEFHYLDRILNIIERAGLKEQVSIHEFVDDPTPFYNWADVVIVPSKRPEPFGLVAIEALSAGAVVIGAEHGGLSEIYVNNHSGIYFNPNDSDDLIKRILSLNNNPQRAVFLAANGRALFEEKYTERAYIARFINGLNKIYT